MSSAPHQSTIEVRFAELDPYNHVNHAVYATYFEVARTEALNDIGLPLPQLAADGYQFVVTELTVRYRKAAAAGDVLTIETAVVELGRASTRWEQRMFRPAARPGSVEGERELVATGALKVGITDRQGKPTRPPAWIFERLQPLVQ